MNRHTAKPACWIDTPPTPRGGDGVRNPFFDQGRSCGLALTRSLWEEAVYLTPGCKGCSRAFRGGVLGGWLQMGEKI